MEVEKYEHLETGQIELLHNQTHERLGAGEEDCDMLRMHHDSLAAELVGRGMSHDTEMLCPEPETNAPNYRRGFTDDTCSTCAFGQLSPWCNLYKFDYTKGYTCDSFRYAEMMELEPPHGFLMANGKQTAVASPSAIDTEKAYVIVSNGEAFGVALFEQAAQVKTPQFETNEWQDQHRVTPRERRQWWGENDLFYVHRLKEWYPYDGVKLYKNGRIVDEPKLTGRQWHLISKAKELPKTILLADDVVSVTEKQEFVINLSAKCKELDSILSAAYETEVKEAAEAKELIPIYSLALVRNPRMRVSKKNIIAEDEASKQEGDNMPYRIRKRDDEYCVVKIEEDDSDGESVGCHETMGEAEDQLAALNINVVAEEESARDKPKKGYIDSDDNIPSPISQQEPIKSKPFMERLKVAAKTIFDIITLAEIEQKETKLFMNKVGIAQKRVNGELWHFTYSTNAFVDREGEIFSTKALEDYVARNEANEEKGFFNLWHINAEDGNFNTDFAQKEWQGVIGRFLVEAGPYLDDERGRTAKEFFKQYGDRHPDLAPEGWGCSPEFRYLPEERATGTYDNIWITRTSTLPKYAAANIWTETRQLKAGSKMALSEQQMKAAVEMFGNDFVQSMIREAEDKTANLEEAGVAHKSQPTDPSEPQEVQLDIEALAQEVSKQFTMDLTPIAEAMATMASSQKEIMTRLEKLEGAQSVKEKTETPRFIFNLNRASEDAQTVVAEGDDLKDRKPQEAKGNSGDPWAQIFR